MGNPRATIAAALAVALAALAAPSVAAAQAAAPPSSVRDGVFGGGGLFGGNISCDGNDCGDFREAAGGSGHVGWMLNPRLGILADFWVLTSNENNVSISFLTATVNVRYWLANALWIQGGLGNGHARIRADLPFVGTVDGRSDNVFVAMLAAGFEVVRGRNWALDLGLKVAQGSDTDADGNSVQTGRSAAIGASITFFTTR